MTDSSPENSGGATTRRGFLKACGTAAIALVGASVVSAPVRKVRGAVPVWATIPDQYWSVGVPVHFDLAAYCTDADGDPLLFDLDQQLPHGVTLNGSVISGTPTGLVPATQYIATADDRGGSVGGQPSVRPRLVAAPNPSSGAVRFLGERGATLESTGTLRVFNPSGRLVYERPVGVTGGHYEIGWDGRSADGAKLPSGVYAVTVTIGSETARTHFVLEQ